MMNRCNEDEMIECWTVMMPALIEWIRRVERVLGYVLENRLQPLGCSVPVPESGNYKIMTWYYVIFLG